MSKFRPLSKVEKERFDDFPSQYSRDEAARGVVNNWARGHSELPEHFVQAIESIIKVSISRIIGSPDASNPVFIFPTEEHSDDLIEGALKQVLVNKYERNIEARNRCIDFYGAICQVCDLEFSKKYGDIGSGFIHVHHIVPLHEIKKEYIIDPIRDLIPVCPNCHSMLHSCEPMLSIRLTRTCYGIKRVKRVVSTLARKALIPTRVAGRFFISFTNLARGTFVK